MKSVPPCSKPECERPVLARGLCRNHYQQQWAAKKRAAQPPRARREPKPCSVDGCDRMAKSRGWCQSHYMRWRHSGEEPTGPLALKRKAPEPCAVDGCDRTARNGPYCRPHAARAKRNNGDPGRPEIREQRGQGQGRSRYEGNGGYAFVKAPPGHPNAYQNGRIMEHTLVMSTLLGRPLVPGENVHHKNGDRGDNRPENLELWSTHQPKGARVVDQLAWARELLDRYGDVDPKVLS